jgi:hypothetical protein
LAKTTKANLRWRLPLILIAAIVSGIAGYAIYDSFIVPSPSSVTLIGSVSSATGLKVPELIIFTNLSSGSSYESYVSGGMSGTYAVTLPNGYSYKVTVTWALKGGGGSVDLGTLDLNSREAAITRNWVG